MFSKLMGEKVGAAQGLDQGGGHARCRTLTSDPATAGDPMAARVPDAATFVAAHQAGAVALGRRLADLIDDPGTFLAVLAAGLPALVDPAHQAMVASVSPGTDGTFAVRGPLREAVVRPVRRALREGSSASALWLAEALAGAGHRDVRLFALPCLRRSLPEDPEQSWQLLRRMAPAPRTGSRWTASRRCRRWACSPRRSAGRSSSSSSTRRVPSSDASWAPRSPRCRTGCPGAACRGRRDGPARAGPHRPAHGRCRRGRPEGALVGPAQLDALRAAGHRRAAAGRDRHRRARRRRRARVGHPRCAVPPAARAGRQPPRPTGGPAA